MKLLVCALVLWICITSADGQDRCYFSRLDALPCPSRRRAADPDTNQYGIYRTRIGFGQTGLIGCRRRGRGVVVRDVTTLGSPEIRLLHSPGFELQPPENYADQMLVVYNIQCGDGERAFFNITRQDIQPRNCDGPRGQQVCADYIEVDRGMYGLTESCGSEIELENMNQLEGQNLIVRFRTSEDNRFPGFEMIVICYRPDERDRPGCTRVEGDNATQSENVSSTDNRKRRDLEDFHNMWKRRLRRQAGDVTFREIIVAFGDQVTYRDQQITVLRNNVSFAFFRNILVLYTFDIEGMLNNYIRAAKDVQGRFIFFRGPGPMTIIGRHAYFQLFAFDPRGIVPTEAEGRVVMELTESQFSQLSPMDDVMVEDPVLPTDPLPTIPGFDIGGRSKRQTNMCSPDSVNRAFEESAVRTAIMNENACNPVLKASARATLNLHNCIDAERVRRIRLELQMMTEPPTTEATEPAVETQPTPETTPIPLTASLNCTLELSGQQGSLDCTTVNVRNTFCFFDGMRNNSLACNEFPTTFTLNQFSQGTHNVTVEAPEIPNIRPAVLTFVIANQDP